MPKQTREVDQADPTLTDLLDKHKNLINQIRGKPARKLVLNTNKGDLIIPLARGVQSKHGDLILMLVSHSEALTRVYFEVHAPMDIGLHSHEQHERVVLSEGTLIERTDGTVLKPGGDKWYPRLTEHDPYYPEPSVGLIEWKPGLEELI